jgi:predicted TIM-barrel fold metal-dependent hydrolase
MKFISRSGAAGLFALACAAWSISAQAQDVAPAPVETIQAIGDYHMHIQGPGISAELQRLKAADPKIFEMMSDDMMHDRGGADAVRILDLAGIRQGTLLSVAYMFASPLLKPAPTDIAGLTRAENAFNVDARLSSDGRLKAFVSVNPIAPGAIEELTYWRNRPGVDGLKLHLANSGFNPRLPGDVEKLAGVFDFARSAALPIAIHVRHAKDYSAEDARVFIDKVLSKAGDLSVQIAHGGSWGSLDQATIDTLSLYADAIERKAPGTKNLVIELALVVIDKKTDPALAAAFAKAMRRIGLDRFILGSDWPAIYTPGDYYALLRTQIPLEPEEWRTIFANEAPYFRHPRGH